MLPANHPIAKFQAPPAIARGAPPAIARGALSTAERLKVEEWTINDLEQRITALYAAHAKLKKLHAKLSGKAVEQSVDDEAYDEVLVEFHAVKAMTEQNEREVAALEKRLWAIESADDRKAAHARQAQVQRPRARMENYKNFPKPARMPIPAPRNPLDEILRLAPADEADDTA